MSKPLRVMKIVEGTSVDGPGLRTSIYLAGCAHQCPGCHNRATWPFDAGSDMTVDEIMETVLYDRFNVTLTGGDPLYQAEALIPLAHAIKEHELGIWCYTGYTFEQLSKMKDPHIRALLEYIDVLVDGPFIESERDTNLHFRGSANQRLIDIPSTLSSGQITLYQQ
ncbi:MAG: anaerobic ribonucleoside-triphosphate reductase activating protein [Bacteroidales bacterium]|nr:anaerobic ribonucleoside-triphosphate reductase activating protein [Bacteroidales bacterium]